MTGLERLTRLLNRLLVFVGGSFLVGMILLMVIVLLVEVLFHRTSEAEIQRKVISEQPLELRQVQAEQLEQLSGYRWVSEPEGVAAIPIDRAIDLVIEEAQTGRKP
jgi:hypothetical protein